MPTTKTITTPEQLCAAAAYLGSIEMPFTLTITPGRHRSTAQNRLQRTWCKQIADHYGDRTAEEVRGYCKAAFGVPILKSDSEMFAEVYDRIMSKHTPQERVGMMMEPFDYPVTRMMTVKQKTRYLDHIFRHFAGEGVRLVIPEDINGIQTEQNSD